MDWEGSLLGLIGVADGHCLEEPRKSAKKRSSIRNSKKASPEYKSKALTLGQHVQ
jgi:hypothetical protein